MSLKLPRFLRGLSIVDVTKGTPTLAFHQWWESVLQQIELSINGIQEALDAAGIALDAAAVAQNAAEAAQTAADTAQNAADVSQSTAKLTTSGITGLTLTATDAGSNSTITISGHQRVYGDGSSVNVTGGSLTGRAYSTQYLIFYNDPDFAGGSVVYQSTTDINSVSQTGSTHIVGSVTTPAAGQPDESGRSPRPPGLYFDTQ